MLAVGTNGAVCAAAAAAATYCTARCYWCIVLAELRVATVYCLLYVCEYGLLLLPYTYWRTTWYRLLLALVLKVISTEI